MFWPNRRIAMLGAVALLSSKSPEALSQDLTRPQAARKLPACEPNVWKTIEISNLEERHELGLEVLDEREHSVHHPVLNSLFEDFPGAFGRPRLVKPLSWDIVVTGIAPEPLSGRTEVQFNATTPRLPDWLVPVGSQGASAAGKAAFRKFDDGWRCEQLKITRRPRFTLRWDAEPGLKQVIMKRERAAATAALGREFKCSSPGSSATACALRFLTVDAATGATRGEIRWRAYVPRKGQVGEFGPPMSFAGTLRGHVFRLKGQVEDALGQSCAMEIVVDHRLPDKHNSDRLRLFRNSCQDSRIGGSFLLQPQVP